MSCIVGHTGFVGMNLLKNFKFDYFYNSKNINEILNMSFDTVFFCGLPAQKWIINNNSENDKKNINNIMNLLKTIKTKKFILISTIDVYEKNNINVDEDYVCDYKNNHPYGKHRYEFELFVKNTFEDHHIIRLPALFGDGLKKNILYDLLNNNNVNMISSNTYFQWYNLNWLYDDINYVIKNNIKLINFFTEKLDSKYILNLFNYNYENNPKNFIEYNLKSKYGFLHSIDDVKNAILDFVKNYKITNDKLIVSNICINNINRIQFYSLLKLYGFKNIEIAPTKLMQWNDFNTENFNYYKNEINNFDLNVYSVQSITYLKTNLNIFDPTTHLNFFMHLRHLFNTLNNNIKIVVFGCPKNRFIINLNNENNLNIAKNFFNIVGDLCELNDIILCVENNSKLYNCNFLNSIDDVGNFVNFVNHKNIKMMVDIGNAYMENDDLNNILKFKDIIYHIHISSPFMKHYESQDLNIKKILDEIKYDKYITLEFLNNDDDLTKLNASLINFKNNF